MVFRRKGRRFLYFQARTKTGWKQLCTHATEKRTAAAIEAMWTQLSEGERAWDVLDRVLARPALIGTLYDQWVASGRNVTALRRLVADVDLTPLVDEFIAVYAGKGVRPDTVEHTRHHLRFLFPEGEPVLRSQITPDWLTAQLYDYEGKPATRRKVHSNWSIFFDYLVSVRRLLESNPMLHVTRPSPTTPPITFYELDQVERIVEWQPTEQRKALMALLYGTGVEVSVVLSLRRSHFNPATKEVRAAGTKAHSRDRVARIADWAWPTAWNYVKLMTTETMPFAGVTRSGAAFWLRQTLIDGIYDSAGRQIKTPLDLGAYYSLHRARDHWAVRSLRAGAPVAVVQGQLGHGSPMLTLTKYGRFMPSAADRDRAEEQATQYEIRRRSASLGASANLSPLTNSRGGT